MNNLKFKHKNAYKIIPANNLTGIYFCLDIELAMQANTDKLRSSRSEQTSSLLDGLTA